jgi:hypothetical protein
MGLRCGQLHSDGGGTMARQRIVGIGQDHSGARMDRPCRDWPREEPVINTDGG